MDLLENNLVDPISHWYYHHKFNVIKRLLKDDLEDAKFLADIGAGSALFSKKLIELYPTLQCRAIDTGYTDEDLSDAKGRISYHREYTQGADIYLFTDVLEHVKEDNEMLRGYTFTAPAGSAFLLTVPAHMALWSGHDVFLNHYRRYSKKDFEKLVTEAGLFIEKSQYIFTPLFPIAFLHRKLPKSKRITSQMRKVNKTLNFLLKILLKIENIPFFLKPFGISVIILARK